MRRPNPDASYVCLGHSHQHPQQSRTANNKAKQQPRLLAIPYQDTLTANQPRPVAPAQQDDDPLPLTAPDVRFPTRFNLYVHLSGRCYLGQHRSDLLYRIAVSHPKITLHNGLKTYDPLIGTLVHRSSYRYHSKARPRPNDEVFLPSGGNITIEREEARSWSNLGRFTVDVPAPDGDGTREESFEWHFTTGPAVGPLGRHAGLKLVRLATDVTGPGHIEHGGGEAVAVLAPSGARWRKTAAFQFLGSGAQRMLGDEWEILAVLTGVGLWDEHKERWHASA